MSNAIPDFTEAEREAVDTLPHRRYGQPTPIELAGAEISLDPGGDETTTCPTLCRAAGGSVIRERHVNVMLSPARAAGGGVAIAR